MWLDDGQFRQWCGSHSNSSVRHSGLLWQLSVGWKLIQPLCTTGQDPTAKSCTIQLNTGLRVSTAPLPSSIWITTVDRRSPSRPTDSPIKIPVGRRLQMHSKPIDYCTCLFRIQRRSFPVFAAEPVVLHDTFETDHSPFDRQRLRTVSSTFSPFIPIKEFRFLPVFFNLILSTDTGVWQRILEEKRTAPSRFTVSVCILWRFFCQRGKMLKKV